MLAEALLMIIIIGLLAALRRSHRKIRELRRSLKKATKWLS